SFSGFAPREPLHNVRQWEGLSEMERYLSIALSLFIILGRLNTDHGGSSGWMAILMPSSSATGRTSCRKYSMFFHSCSASTISYALKESSIVLSLSGSHPGVVLPESVVCLISSSGSILSSLVFFYYCAVVTSSNS